MSPKRKAPELDAFRLLFGLLFGKRETAAILGISTRTLEGLLYNGTLPAIRIGKRVLFHKKTIESFARRGAA